LARPFKGAIFVTQFPSMSSLLPSFLKTARPKSFEPRTRYYDERKEQLDALIDKHSRPDSKEAYRVRLRGEFQKHRRARADKSSNLRVLLIVALLLLLVYYLYK
jgi:hypothetical protein